MDTVKASVSDFIRQYKFVILVALLGIGLMLLPESNGEEPQATAPQVQEPDDIQSELEQILAQIQGVGKVSVMLTVSEGEQTLYEYNEDSSGSTDSSSLRRETVIITDSERAQLGLVQQVIPPVYQGAIVVCQGGDQPSVRLAIVEAVSAATGLSADKISVLKMK